jgi:hypothetical protein
MSENCEIKAQITCCVLVCDRTLEHYNIQTNWMKSWKVNQILYLAIASDLCISYVKLWIDSIATSGYL